MRRRIHVCHMRRRIHVSRLVADSLYLLYALNFLYPFGGYACVSYEEEDTCVSYEEEDTCVKTGC
jgi:hypothetical protein